ncbi:MAG TPA: EamA family transporter, partial [Rhodospirillales bacterium]|nr:EamA family transporter [Rhodospirillales bacterium]
MNIQNKDQSLVGAFAALAAFSIWGFIPLYFKAVSHLPAFEILAHRIVWTVFFVGMLIIITGNLKNVHAVFANRKLLATLLLSSLLISLNWLVFIWAISHDMVLQSSLGYFINPLVNLALG